MKNALEIIISDIKINIIKQSQNKEQKGVSRWRRLFVLKIKIYKKYRVMYNPIINTIGTDMEGEKTE
mgnify:CR=1 FL=1